MTIRVSWFFILDKARQGCHMRPQVLSVPSIIAGKAHVMDRAPFPGVAKRMPEIPIPDLDFGRVHLRSTVENPHRAIGKAGGLRNKLQFRLKRLVQKRFERVLLVAVRKKASISPLFSGWRPISSRTSLLSSWEA